MLLLVLGLPAQTPPPQQTSGTPDEPVAFPQEEDPGVAEAEEALAGTPPPAAGLESAQPKPGLAPASEPPENEEPGAATPTPGEVEARQESPLKEDKTEDLGPTSVQWLGDRYVLGRSSSKGTTDCDEYFPEDEGPAQWTRLVAVQRAAETELAAFVRRLLSSGGREFVLLRRAAGACALGIKRGGPEGQEGVMLVRAQVEKGRGVCVVTYLQKSHHLDEAKAQLHLEAWRERLQAGVPLSRGDD